MSRYIYRNSPAVLDTVIIKNNTGIHGIEVTSCRVESRHGVGILIEPGCCWNECVRSSVACDITSRTVLFFSGNARASAWLGGALIRTTSASANEKMDNRINIVLQGEYNILEIDSVFRFWSLFPLVLQSGERLETEAGERQRTKRMEVKMARKRRQQRLLSANVWGACPFLN